ncbi:hypothetical protein WJ47_20245 [Burkholderia ubonensis]|uniref:Uncharacterized protein n=1 Tax=Burkholderia ubonensis TaxID=101571 RepID=A0AB73FYX6_9BURK|nr:hypothetical protein [Burkholderia ubonensis]KVK74702.1 hypothetical protein WJ44_17300 [Burkholderia ubonensis]KVL60520.1 hypothetical protein WJ47_20245 [Burkholderia ubonensis]KVM22451.1 hypothetical protein WJ54_24030 [Burkholderia ubonensis]KVM30357.1 hypothetical protein WJ53_06785 [Burkholderia ubonensis]KVN56681.1 hypothetical protein WJ65_25550 [Burkholderia ubonensis]
MKIDSSLVAGPAQAAANPTTAGASGNQQATAAGSTAAGSTAASGTSAGAKANANAAQPASTEGSAPLGGANSKAEDPAVKQLKELIEKLQKQLAQLEAQIAQAGQRAKKDPAAQIEQQALVAQAGEVSAALQTAVAKMVELLRKQSSNPTGGLVSTQA